MKNIGYIVVTLVSAIVNTIYGGYALSVLWQWFISRTFGITQLSIPAAIGLSLIISYLTHQTLPEDSNDKNKTYGEKLFKGIIIGILKPSFALFFGWIVFQFMK